MLALVIGCAGQDGVYLTRQLAEKGYEVLGLDRNLVEGKGSWDAVNLSDGSALDRLIVRAQPAEVYYLAAFHHSSEDPPIDDREDLTNSFQTNTLGLTNLLSAIDRYSRRSRLFYAASSRIFGDPVEPVQNEETPFRPVCPYGISKVAGIHICRYFREKRGLYTAAGIAYNHESPLRPARFVTRKVVNAAVRIRRGSAEKLTLGNLEARVDWGYAPDFTQAMWRILQLETGEDFVIGTGELHTVGDLVEAAFFALGLDWAEHVEVKTALLQGKAPRTTVCADASKLRRMTGWRPSVSFREMVTLMVKAESADR